MVKEPYAEAFSFYDRNPGPTSDSEKRFFALILACGPSSDSELENWASSALALHRRTPSRVMPAWLCVCKAGLCQPCMLSGGPLCGPPAYFYIYSRA